MRSSILIALLAFTLFSCSKNNHTVSGSTAFNESKADSLLELLYENDKFMGSASVSQNGSVIYSIAIGFDDIETNKKSTTASKYRIASVSKMFTAALVFQAIEENKLTLGQTIQEYFPDVEYADKITIRDLLNHRSGIRNYTSDASFFDYRTEYKSAEEMVEMIANYPSNFEPGSNAEYSNSNYLLLSVILEKIYESDFKTLLEDKISTPLGLQNTYYGSKISLDNNESNSYSIESQWSKEVDSDLSVAMGAGGIVSTPADLNKFLEGLFNGEIISNGSLQTMITIEDNYGMGIMPFSFNEKSGFGHGGNIEGFNSLAVYLPEDSLAISVTANAIDYNMAALVQDLAKSYYNIPFSLPNFETVEISADELEKYAGIYHGPGGGTFTITQQEDILYSQLNDTPAAPLVYKGNHKFLMEENGAEFIFNPEEGQLSLVQMGIADPYIFEKE